MKIKFINKSLNPDPEFATDGSAGVDLRAHISGGKLQLEPGKFILIPTGIYIELQPGLMAMITPKSGLASKFGISIVNTPGIIDSDYRGEIKISIINHGPDIYEIYNGDRIAQMIVVPYLQFELEKTDELSTTDRGAGGFGSTGIK